MPLTPAALRDRFYADFLMPSRLGAYRGLLESALAAGYEIVSVEHIWRIIAADRLDPGRRVLVLRHDIDTDPATAAAMWAIDRDLGVESSYFFRLSTLDPALMADIAAYGSHASYHYEELANVAKRRRLRNGSDVIAHLPEARDRFRRNVSRLRHITGLPMRVVAAHGDFVNRALRSPNWLILDDPVFRHEVDVELEAYDEALLRHLPRRYTDTLHPTYWLPNDPAEAICRCEPTIQVLVHPRHWRVARVTNGYDDLRRLAEGLRFGLRLGRCRCTLAGQASQSRPGRVRSEAGRRPPSLPTELPQATEHAYPVGEMQHRVHGCEERDRPHGPA